jgi:hypothetical protein
MRKTPAMLATLTVIAAMSCRRPLRLLGGEAGDTGVPANADAAPTDAAPTDAASTDAAPTDALATIDASVDVPADLTIDSIADATVGVCPAAVVPLDVCGCGCCGGEAPMGACYYPSLGESRDAIPNPMPTPAECANDGCIEGSRYVCCADPGPAPAHGTICAFDTSLEDLPRFTVTERDGDVCTTLEIGGTVPRFRISTPPAYAGTNGWRGPCDKSTAPVWAIGGLGQVTPGRSGTLLPFPRCDVHVALFFDSGSGVADVVRIDRDDVGVAPQCASVTCPVCGK